MKLKTILRTSLCLLSASPVLAADYVITDVANVRITANSDDSAHNEGVFIRSNDNGDAQVNLTSDGNVSIVGNTTMSGFLDVSGNLNVDGSVANATGNFTVSDNLDVTGATDLNNGLNVDGNTTLDATTIVGATSVTGATTINTTTGSAASTIGTSGNATSILSTTVSIGNATANTSVDIARGSGANAIVLGNINPATTMRTIAGNSEITMSDGTAVMGIDPANTGTSLSAATMIAQNGEKRIVADENGKLEVVTTADTTSGTTAAMVVTNSAGNTHGIVVQEDKTVVSGGTSSSSLTLADNGATFSNSATGEPIQVHGVADGTADFDATNVRQVYSGLAAVLAATPDLRLEPGKTGAGIGLGSYGGFHAVGFGLGHMYDNGAVLTVSAGKASHSKVAYKAGLSWSW